MHRRTFLKTGLAAATLAGVPCLAEEKVNDKSVIFIWLGGGISQFESFHGQDSSVPDVYRSVNGVVTHKNGLKFGADWTNLIQRGDFLTSVDSFSHYDSSHNTGTHFVMTGHYTKKRGPGATPEYPGNGAIVSSVFGSNHPVNGIPTYVKQGKIEGEGSAFLGSQHKPFDPSNKENLIPKVEARRLVERRNLLSGFDSGLTSLSEKAFNVIQGDAGSAFDLEKELAETKSRYGDTAIGKQLLLARRLVEHGTKFVTIHYGGWDNHSNISTAVKSRIPPVDLALSSLIDELNERGMTKDVMVVVSAEFGRTSLNKSIGRDHWPKSTSLLLAGGAYEHGRTVGKADKSYVPTNSPFGPLDLQRTIFDHFGIDPTIQRIDTSGRPRYLSEGGSVIL